MRLLFDRSHSPVSAGPFSCNTCKSRAHAHITGPLLTKGPCLFSSLTGPALLSLLVTSIPTLANLTKEAPLCLVFGRSPPSCCACLALPLFIFSKLAMNLSHIHMDRPADCPACYHIHPEVESPSASCCMVALLKSSTLCQHCNAGLALNASVLADSGIDFLANMGYMCHICNVHNSHILRVCVSSAA